MTKMHEAIEVYFCELHGHTVFVSPDNFSLHLNPQQTGTPNEIYLQHAGSALRQGSPRCEHESAAKANIPQAIRHYDGFARGDLDCCLEKYASKSSFFVKRHLRIRLPTPLLLRNYIPALISGVKQKRKKAPPSVASEHSAIA
jgi:hypothetical protein